MNVLQYSALEQSKFTSVMSDYGYTTLTTFFGDLSIGEWFGEKGVRDTYKDVVASWLGNVKFFTEFVMALNHKIWEHYKTRPELGRLYDELWRDAERRFFERYKDDQEAISYYYNTTD